MSPLHKDLSHMVCLWVVLYLTTEKVNVLSLANKRYAEINFFPGRYFSLVCLCMLLGARGSILITAQHNLLGSSVLTAGRWDVLLMLAMLWRDEERLEGVFVHLKVIRKCFAQLGETNCRALVVL